MPTPGLEKDFEELIGVGGTSVSIYKKSGVNQRGEVTYPAQPSNVYPAMVVRATKQVRSKDNEVKVSSAQVYLMGDYGIQPDDKIVLPDGTSPKILYIGAWSDDVGAYTQCIYT